MMSQISACDVEMVRSGVADWLSRGAIFKPDPAIWWMGGGLGAFCALPRGGERVQLFVTGRDATIRSRVGVVTLRWADRPQLVKISTQPVLDLGAPGTFDMDGVSYPWIVDNGGELWMYYVGWNRLGGDIPFRNQIGLAISSNGGKTFERVTRAPLLPLTDEEPIGSGSTYVDRVPGGWRMLYTSFLRWERRPEGPRHYYHIREAYSVDGIKWDRPGKVIVDLVPPDEYALGAPDVAIVNGRRILYFTTRGNRYRLFAAVEGSKGAWTRLPGALNIPRGDFDSDMQCYPRTLALGGKLHLLYCGNGYGRAGIGYAELAAE
jgi:hypothetical protein